MKKELKEFRKSMKEKKITAWLSPCLDRHGSEYIGAHDECIRFLSGFTGDSCMLLVLPDAAYLWTDGRYFVQAAAELKNSGVKLMKMGEPGVPTLEEFILRTLKGGDCLGFYAPLFPARRMEALTRRLSEKCVNIMTSEDLVDTIWKDRPARSCNPVWIHDLSYAGESTAQKLKKVRLAMKEHRCDIYLTSVLNETAWLTNLRGSDIECNPLFLSYLMISEKTCRLFVQKKALNAEVRTYCRKNSVMLCDYEDWGKETKRLKGHRILIDLTASDFETYRNISGNNETEDAISPISLFKCVKNETEIRHMKQSHIRDGAAETKYLYWLLQSVKSGKKLSETDAAAHLDMLRGRNSRFVSLSFPTISAYGPNAAMCHYMPVPETAAVILPKGLYLVDSGAQYLDGTTDVTRTYAMGKTTLQQRTDYTLTVIGMLRLMHAVFPEGIRGTNLDTFARKPLWEKGRDFNHGTGHGVGFLSNVHEMPVSVRVHPNADPRKDLPFVPGMITSDEPGIYIDGKYGIRTENMILCVRDKKRKGFLKFEPLTFVPLDPAPLETSLMTEEDISFYNSYQAEVRKKIGPHLNRAEREWLNHETAEISKTGKRSVL